MLSQMRSPLLMEQEIFMGFLILSNPSFVAETATLPLEPLHSSMNFTGFSALPILAFPSRMTLPFLSIFPDAVL